MMKIEVTGLSTIANMPSNLIGLNKDSKKLPRKSFFAKQIMIDIDESMNDRKKSLPSQSSTESIMDHI